MSKAKAGSSTGMIKIGSTDFSSALIDATRAAQTISEFLFIAATIDEAAVEAIVALFSLKNWVPMDMIKYLFAIDWSQVGTFKNLEEFLVAAITIGLTRGTTISAMGMSANAQMIAIRKIVNDKAEGDPSRVTIARIMIAFPILTSRIASVAVVKANIEQKFPIMSPLPAAFRFPGAASIVPDGLIPAFTEFIVKFDSVVNQKKPGGPNAEQAKRYARTTRASQFAREIQSRSQVLQYVTAAAPGHEAKFTQSF